MVQKLSRAANFGGTKANLQKKIYQEKVSYFEDQLAEKKNIK